MRGFIIDKYKFFVKKINVLINKVSESLNLNKNVVIKIGMFFLLLMCFFALYNKGRTKEWILEKFPIAIEKKDLRLLSQCIKVDNRTVSKDELIPLMNYYNENDEKMSSAIKGLKNNGDGDIVTLIEESKLVGKSYYLNVDTVDIEVIGYSSGVEMMLNGQKVKSDEEITELIPGVYSIEYIIETVIGDVVGEVTREIIESGKINIDFAITNITINSEFSEADVYIDGKSLDKKAKDIVNYGPIPTDRDVKLYIEQEFPWGKIKSDEVVVGDGGILKLDINMANEVLINDVNIVLNEFYNSVFEALNEENKNIITRATDEVKDKIYDNIMKKSFIFSNGYKISELNLKIENSEFEFVDESYEGNLVVNIQYDIYKKIIPFVKENREELFLVGTEYKENAWEIVSVQRFSVIEEN